MLNAALHTAIISSLIFPLRTYYAFSQRRKHFTLYSPNAKRKFKDQKFGFGGKKSGKKWNTKDSYNDVSSFRAKVAHAKGGKGGKKGKGGKQNVSVAYERLLPDSKNKFSNGSIKITLQ